MLKMFPPNNIEYHIGLLDHCCNSPFSKVISGVPQDRLILLLLGQYYFSLVEIISTQFYEIIRAYNCFSDDAELHSSINIDAASVPPQF